MVLDEIKDGKSKYSFIEIMTCPGGCVNGGGQPIVDESKFSTEDVIKLRSSALYKADKNSKYRKSYQNPVVIEIYDKVFKTPNSKKAHKYLHTSYNKQEVYIDN